MKIIELLIVLLLIFILINFYIGGFQDRGKNKVINQQKIYIESQEKLENAKEIIKKEYKKYEKID